MNHDEGEQAARVWFYAQPASADPWQPGKPDKLAAGLLKAAKEAREARK
jgi:hypothetical protein